MIAPSAYLGTNISFMHCWTPRPAGSHTQSAYKRVLYLLATYMYIRVSTSSHKHRHKNSNDCHHRQLQF